ncbi:MAG: Alpha/beta hydrolase family protein [Parcubacteria group bacterium ADurb.Bin316]|nr:MAG: Alpha/beta hydrolase family protein [Parcubacteria group bacterium ADurb.Bin316]HOZ56452.1 alpha/beta hydrolase [bacterium]
MKNQIIFIRGGEAFDTKEQYYNYLRQREYNPFEQKKSWRDWIGWALSEEYEMMMPTMPNKHNADYLSWQIWFEKLFPYLNDQKLIVIGHSLGCIFLAKYLSENKFPKIIDQLHLVAPVFESEGLNGETVGDFTLNKNKLVNLGKQAKVIYIYCSQDDPVTPLRHGELYKEYLPKAELLIFEDRGHFIQPALPELLGNIYKLEGK